MPKPGHARWHIIWHTYGVWLPGDPRGFRNRDHRIHSSGDYRNPPPKDEHKGLREYARRVSKSEVVLSTQNLRRQACEAIVNQILSMDFRLLIVTVARVHVHFVAELPVGRCFHPGDDEDKDQIQCNGERQIIIAPLGARLDE